MKSPQSVNLVHSFHKRGYNLTCSPTPSSSITDTTSSSSSSATSSSASGNPPSRSTLDILQLREPKHGQTAIHLAVRKGDMEVLRAFVQSSNAKAFINVQDNNGNTALHFAVARRNGDVYATRLLLEAGASLQVKNHAGLTPVGAHILTLKHDKANIVELLLHYGADANTMVEGASLLHFAVEKRCVLVATCLVQFGADLTLKDTNSRMVYEVTPRPILIKLISQLHYPPAYVGPRHQNYCVQCHAGPFVDLRRPKRGLAMLLRQIFSPLKLVESRNCYHCGLIFCTSCASHDLNVGALPATFTRASSDSPPPR